MSVLQLKDITKSFFGVQVLHGISLELNEGEILGLVGENGAGKSTMMNIIGGVLQPDSGSMILRGEAYQPENPQVATDHGISFIHQELSLFSNLTVAENIYIDAYPIGKFGMIDKKKMAETTSEYLKKYHIENVLPSTSIGQLPMGTRQMIEIIKALVKNSHILIFDEPTTSLSNREKDLLFKTLDELRSAGYSIIYISHILEDVLMLSNRIYVLRDGSIVANGPTNEWDRDRLIHEMVGRDIKQVYPTLEKTIEDEVIFEVKDLCCADTVEDVSFAIRKGEILGMFGLMGAGRSEVARAIFGVDPIQAGQVVIKGKEYNKTTPELCINNGMAFITENRREEGLMMPKPVNDNIAMVMDRNLVGKLGMIDRTQESELTDRIIHAVSVKVSNSKTQTANSLSGGNQQKVVIGKWIVTKPEIFIVDEPTRGVDVGAKYEIYKLLLKLASEGAAILFISSEMEELMGISDRIVVMKAGHLVKSIDKPDFSSDVIGSYAI